MSTVKTAISLIGLSAIARRFGYRPSAIQKWRDDGRLPRSDLAGLTFYARGIAELSAKTEKPVTAEQLLTDTRLAWEAHTEAQSKAKRRRIEARAG